MTIKHIAIHLDDSERCGVRLDLAIKLAQRFGARLSGIFAQSDPNMPGLSHKWPTEFFLKVSAASEADFTQRAAAAGVAADWCLVPSGGQEDIIRDVVLAARCSDLMVLGQHDPYKGTGAVPPELAEQVVLNAGRAVLIIPYAGRFETVGERPLVAWNAGREAARAMGDAMPFLASAKSVRLVAINPGRLQTSPSCADIFAHLRAYGIEAISDTLTVEDIGVMDMLLSRTADTDADMIVMGGHAHYGFPYFNRGGGTRHILRHMTVPVLMSH